MEDQQIPDALQVQQSTGSVSAATKVILGFEGVRIGIGVVWFGLVSFGGWVAVGRRI